MNERKLRPETTDKYGRNFPRASVSDFELQLNVPDGLIPDDMVGHWFSDATPNRIEQKLREWWVPVVGSDGNAVKVRSGDGYLHLMMIEKELNEKDHKLREDRYRATVSEVINSPSLGEGIEVHKPSGDAQIKISKDRDVFAS